MINFNHINAESLGEAAGLLQSSKGKAKVMAGGTDLLGVLKDRILPEYPETIINLKTIPGLKNIEEAGGRLKIGALTTLEAIVQSPLIQERCRILVDAAKSVASLQIRNLGTLGGNLCQDLRCMYYRYPYQIGGRLMCKRKGEGACLAVKGDNRYHAIMGAKGCFAVCPSDMAVALSALDATITLGGSGGSRTLPVASFYTPAGMVLEPGEILTTVSVPLPSRAVKTAFSKFRLRDAIDFAIVSVASALTVSHGTCEDARIILGAVAPFPFRAEKAESYIKGKPLTEKTAAQAALLALEKAKPLSMNAYKIQIAKTLIVKSILGRADR